DLRVNPFDDDSPSPFFNLHTRTRSACIDRVSYQQFLLVRARNERCRVGALVWGFRRLPAVFTATDTRVPESITAPAVPFWEQADERPAPRSKEHGQMITRIGLVPVWVSDQDAALEFYIGKLGFEKVSDSGEQDG